MNKSNPIRREDHFANRSIGEQGVSINEVGAPLIIENDNNIKRSGALNRLINLMGAAGRDDLNRNEDGNFLTNARKYKLEELNKENSHQRIMNDYQEFLKRQGVPADRIEAAGRALAILIEDMKRPEPELMPALLASEGSKPVLGRFTQAVKEEREPAVAGVRVGRSDWEAMATLPKVAPEGWPNWKRDKQPGDTPVSFIQRHYAPWLGKGLSRPDIKRLDKGLYTALYNWLKGNKLPDDFDLPTRAQENDLLLEAGVVPTELARRVAGAKEWRAKKQRIV